MGFRAYIARSPKLSTTVAVVVLAGALTSIFLSLGNSHTSAELRRFYSTDDGLTYFDDVITRIPPFDHDGREAVVAHVFEDGGRQFVGYLEKYSPEVAEKLSSIERLEDRLSIVEKDPQAILVKRPGDPNWVVSSTPAGMAVRSSVHTNDGQIPKVVLP